MKKILLIIIFVFSCTFYLQAQKFKTHKVKDGETIETIAMRYLVTPFDIYALNPDAKNKFAVNLVLIIPNSKVKNEDVSKETREVIGFKKHKVKRKETLFSLSQKYHIEIEDIKKYNTFLYSENLKKGNRIRIPRFKTVVSQISLNNTLKKYIVLPKEGKWRVAYKFGITVDELEALNPNMSEVLQPGNKLNVPNIANNEEKSIDETYNYYTVLKSEGYLALNRKLGLSQDQLEELNPELIEGGLKLGMVIKIPKDIDTVEEQAEIKYTNLSSNLSNLSTKRIALMLPYRLNRIDTDSVAEARSMIRKDRLLSMSLDLHYGVLMALDSAKQLGISTTLKVFDTRNQISEISNILNENDFSDYDAIIGPMRPKNFDRVASTLKRDRVPVLSPLSKPIKLYENVFQTVPSKELLQKTMLQFVKNDSTKVQVIIISDQKNRAKSNSIKAEFSNAKQVFSRKNKDGIDKSYILIDDLFDVFKKGKNIVFLETSNEAFASNVISMLNGLEFDAKYRQLKREDFEIILMTTDLNKAFEGNSIDNVHLSNLNFHYPTPNKRYDENVTSSFIKQYKKTYGVSPNKYAVRGFDLTLDLLLRLASEDDLYQASGNDIETEYIENKFRYSKKLFGGYFNEAVYIVMYDDLRIVEAKE